MLGADASEANISQIYQPQRLACADGWDSGSSPDDKPAHWQLAFAYERANMANLAADEWRKVQIGRASWRERV